MKEEIRPWRMEKGRGRKVCPPFLRFKTLQESLLGISSLPSLTHLLTLLVPSPALHVQPKDLYQGYIIPTQSSCQHFLSFPAPSSKDPHTQGR